MRIYTNGNGKGIKLAKSGIGSGNGNEPLGMGLKKIFPLISSLLPRCQSA